MFDSVENLNVTALQAAAMFASKDATRPVLGQVAMYAPDLFAATNSYVLVMVGAVGDKPATVVERTMAASASSGGPLLIDAAEAIKYAKLVAKDKFLPSTLTRDGKVIVLSNGATSQRHLGLDAYFPAVHQLVKADTPDALAGVGLNPAYVDTLGKAGVIAGAAKWGSDGRGGTPVVFWGGTDAHKPVYWSISSHDMPTIVLLQMPVRVPGDKVAWRTETEVATVAA